MSNFLGIDLGTTGLKVSLMSEDGKLIGSEYSEYPILSPKPGYAEQDPNLWWRGCIDGLLSLKMKLPEDFGKVVGVGICGQMHTQVYLDEDDAVLRPAITWMDQRSSGIVEGLNRDPAAKALVYKSTQNTASTTYTAPQVQWVKLNQPDVWRKIHKILIAKDFIKFKLTGQMVTDVSDASGTLLFNVSERTWSEAMFEFFEIPPTTFPDVQPSDEIIGFVTPEASALTGIKAGTPVSNGSTDNSASALGAGMIIPGQVTLIIGTAGVISVCSDRPLPDPLDRTLCWNYCLRDRWITLGITQTAGESLNWFKNAFDSAQKGTGSEDVFETYNQAIAKIPDGSGGVIFLPYLNGERTPYWDPAARGVFYGINLTTEKPHFIKAIMEGVSMALRNNIETVESLGIEIEQVRAVGGGLKSEVWLNTLGRILKKPIVTVSIPDTANLGNMIICGRALGGFSSLDESIARMVTIDQQVHFPDGSPILEGQYATFLELYDQLKTTFRKSFAE